MEDHLKMIHNFYPFNKVIILTEHTKYLVYYYSFFKDIKVIFHCDFSGNKEIDDVSNFICLMGK